MTADVDDVTVRKAELDDVPRVIAGYEWLFEPPGSKPHTWDPERAAEALRRAINSDAAVVLIAMSRGDAVGICTAYEDLESVRFGRRVWVEDLAVHPEVRSRGVGRQLLDAAKRWAKQRGASRLQLDSSDLRVDAHRFYERERPDMRSRSFGWWL